MPNNMLPALLTQQNQYQKEFESGLKHMLTHSDELGVFILVLANATYDPALYTLFKESLKSKFAYFEALFKSTKDVASLGAPDDVAVFQQLMDIGFEQCGLNQIRHEGDWTLQFNPLRSLRPARNSQAAVSSVNQTFNHNGFHFNKPFLQKEELWQGVVADKNCRILYNKFPFACYHSLLVIGSEQNKNQWVKQEDLEFLWQFQHSLMPNMLISYNSIGAYASINHQHFQLSIDDGSMTSIGLNKWVHNGGDKHYPLRCLTASTAVEAWSIIQQLQTDNCAFNVFLKHNKMIVVPRLMQGHYTHELWTAGFGWAEVFGLFYLGDKAHYDSLNSDDIEKELRQLTIK